MKFLTDEQLSELLPAETSSFPSPVPTQIVSSDEYLPVPQTEKQREVEARLKEMSDRLARRQGVSRRRFFQTASGMAASFVAMNQVFGHIFDASLAEAATPDMAADRAQALSGQFIIDGHTHFLRDDTRLTGFVKMRNAFGKLGWNKELTGDQTLDDLKYANYIKEVYMDSDTKVALLSNSPSDVPQDWFIPQAQVFETRAKVNKQAGSRRMMAHFTITPGQPGWLDQVDQAIEVYKPDSWKGYTVGDNTHKELAHYPWHADDEKLMYPVLRKDFEIRHQERLHPQGAVRTRCRKAVPAAAALCRCQRYRQGGQGLAATEFPGLPFGLSLGRRHPGRRHGRVRPDRPQLVDQRSRRDPAEIRRHQRLWRSRADLRLDRGRRAAPRRGLDGHAGQGSRPRPRRLGHRCGMDRRAAMADRRAAPPRNPRGHAKEIRLPAIGPGQRPDQDRESSVGTRRASTISSSTLSSASPIISPN